MNRLQIGVVYPQTELQGDPSAVRRIGRAVEELGFDHLLAYDHVLGAVHEDRARPLTGSYSERDPFHDPLVMFAHLAGITERIQFATGVMVLPQRQTALVARQAADVDLFSGGRLRLGVGAGWNHVEYEALGQEFRGRGARQEEQIEVLRRLSTEPIVDFSGRFHRVDRATLLPKPSRSIPIWLGGHQKLHSTVQLASQMGSSSSEAAPTTPSTPGRSCATASEPSVGQSMISARTGSRSLTAAGRKLHQMLTPGATRAAATSRSSAWDSG